MIVEFENETLQKKRANGNGVNWFESKGVTQT